MQIESFQYYKRLFLVLGGTGLFSLLGYSQHASSSLGDLFLDYSGSRVQRSADGRELDITFSVSPVDKLKSQEAVYIFPRYVSSDGTKSVDLEPVCVSGKRRYKVLKRRMALHNKKTGEPVVENVYSIKKLKDSSLTQERHVPFERWMADGYISVQESSYGCAECGIRNGLGRVNSGSIRLFGPAYYTYDFVTPEKVLVKCYEDAFDCKVTFPVARYVLSPSFENNKAALSDLERFVSQSLKIKGARLTEVSIKGYASPEGNFTSNKTLSEQRTHALAEYISRKYPELSQASVYHTAGIGEDWDGLSHAVSSSDLPYKSEILSAISSNVTDTDRESAILGLDGGKVYGRLLSDFYPALRRTTFTLRFDVRPYTVEELPEAFASSPGCLSQYEMFLLAEQYVSHGKSPVVIYKKSYEQFSPNAVAALNYANALLKYAKDADSALRVLESVKNDLRSIYPMAVAYDMKGDWQKAEALLRTAQIKGDSRAVSYFESVTP